jgi:hypothetical protein
LRRARGRLDGDLRLLELHADAEHDFLEEFLVAQLALWSLQELRQGVDHTRL